MSANLIKELREKTGAGLLDCKNALVECKNDIEQAIEYLRKKGLANAAKKIGNTAAEGVIAIKVENNTAAIIELNSQTDFVARNEHFQKLADNIVKAALNAEDIESLKTKTLPNGKTVGNEIIENIASIGENISLRRCKLLKVHQGLIASYIHNKIANDIGSIGVLLAIETSLEPAKLESFGKHLAMHIASTNPQSLDVSSLSQEVIIQEKNIAFEQSKASGKPENVVEKMVEGRMRKFYEESVFLEQIFVMDSKTKISDLIATKAKELGGEIKIVDFVRYKVGEGVVQKVTNFAEEVAAMSKG